MSSHNDDTATTHVETAEEVGQAYEDVYGDLADDDLLGEWYDARRAWNLSGFVDSRQAIRMRVAQRLVLARMARPTAGS